MKKWSVLPLALLLGTALAGAPSPAAAELKVGISGYVKLDIQYGDKLTGELPSPGPTNVPLDTDAVKDNSQTIIDGRQSRLRVTFSDEAVGVKMSGAIEFDFYTKDVSPDSPGLATSNSVRPRLRHAYARADHPSGFFLLAGQWWSLFQNETIAQPPLVDFNGPIAQIFARQPQLRVGYKNPLASDMGNLVFEVDVEKAFTDNDGDGDPDVVENRGEAQDVPLFAGKFSWLHPRFQAEVAGAITDSKVILPSGADASATAWGGQVSAQTNVLYDPLTVFAHFHVQEGLGRLLNGDFANAVIVDGTANLESVKTIGWYAGATYKITPDTSVTGLYGWHEADEIPGPGGLTGTELETHRGIHLNVIHKFWQRWQAGLEYRRFEVEAFNGIDGDVNFIHGALWFFF